MSEYNPLDQEAQDRVRKDRNTRDKLVDQTEVEDIKWLMGSKQGRRVVAKLMERAGLFQPSFNTNSMTMAFAEGAKCEGRYLQAIVLRNCPELYLTMLKEANK